MDTMLDQETLGKLQELLKDSDPNKPPSTKELLGMLDKVELSDEVRENLKAMLTGNVPKIFGSTSEAYVALMFVFLVISLIVFFGYKLYKSLKEKERKREDKKKAKQMKKKK